METTKQLTDSQKRALELIKKLADEGKIDLADAVQLIIAIYENEKEFVYIPYQTPCPDPYPWTTEPYKDEPYKTPLTTGPVIAPWWERNKFWCDMNNANNAQEGSGVFTYAINGQKRDPFDWSVDTWIG